MVAELNCGILCPACGGVVTSSGRCSSCKHSFLTSEGIVDLIPSEDFYWGEIPKSLMCQLVDIARSAGSCQALDELKRQRPNTHDFVTRPNRADWFYLINGLPDGFTAVDWGSGWGSNAFLLAHRAGKVFSVEATKERALWQVLRKHELRIDHVDIIRGNVLDTGFPDETVDLTVANGLVEWLGLMNSQPVDEIFCEFLRRNYSLLKPGGFFYCGIENRYMIHSFLGALDHSGYRFTNLMPRSIANAYCNLKKPARYLTETAIRGYRTYTYSYWAWKKMLREAGFDDVHVFGLLPSYNQIELQCRLDDSHVYRYLVDNFVGEHSTKRKILGLLSRIGSRFGMQRLLHPYFGIVARKPAGPRGNTFRPPDIVRTKASSGTVLTFTLHQKQCKSVVHKTVRAGCSGKPINAEIESLQNVRDVLGDWICDYIPRILSIDEKKSHTTGFALRGVDGESLGKLLDRVTLTDRRLSTLGPVVDGFRIIERMAAAQVTYNHDFAGKQVERITGKLSKCTRDLCAANLLVRMRQIAKDVELSHLPLVPQHGDFTASNIFVAQDSICAIIDWEFFTRYGLPLHDSLFFALSAAGFLAESKATTRKNASTRYEKAFEACFYSRAKQYKRVLQTHLERLQTHLDLDAMQMSFLLFLFIADLATRFYNVDNEKRLDPRFIKVVERLVDDGLVFEDAGAWSCGR